MMKRFTYLFINNALNKRQQESFVRKRVMYEGALQELEHIGPRLLDAMEKCPSPRGNAMEEKRMKDNDDGEQPVSLLGEEVERKTGRSPVMASSASPKSPPRLPLFWEDGGRGDVVAAFTRDAASASIVATAARMKKRDGRNIDSEDCGRDWYRCTLRDYFDVKRVVGGNRARE